MRFLARTATVVGLLYLAGCGGGGSSSPSIPPTVGVPAPTPTAAGPTTAPTTRPTVPPTIAPTVPPTIPPTPVPTVVPVANATSTPTLLADNPAVIYGDPSTFSAKGAPGFAPIDNVPCTGPLQKLGQHFHVHLTLYVNGKQFAIPAAIGIYHPTRLFGLPNGYAGWFNIDQTVDPTACHYDIHVHAGDGVIHIETPNVADVFTLKQFLDIWGVAKTTTGFWTFTGPTRWFETNENVGTPGTYKVTEITGVDPGTIQLTMHTEFTVEVGAPLLPTPNYTFDEPEL